jgi:hypothetical protein
VRQTPFLVSVTHQRGAVRVLAVRQTPRRLGVYLVAGDAEKSGTLALPDRLLSAVVAEIEQRLPVVVPIILTNLCRPERLGNPENRPASDGAVK